jgi:hypothetical protein
MQVALIPQAKIAVVIPMFSAIDKLDKEPWDVVRKEMVDKKGLAGEVADKLQVSCCANLGVGSNGAMWLTCCRFLLIPSIPVGSRPAHLPL